MYIWTSFFIWNTDDFYCIYRLPRQQAGKEEVDRRSLTIIENAIDACHKFQDKTGRYGESVLEDFQLIDWTLLESGLASADAW